MRPLIRTTLALTAAAVLGAPTAAAHGAPPQVTTFDDTESFTADPGDLCDFAVDFTFHNVGTASVVKTGTGTRETDHITETDTMAAFGRSITGQPYSYTLDVTFDADGHVTSLHGQGISWSFVLPDGTKVHAAGWTDFQGHVRGLDVNLAPVCAYLAG
jgi:hypothetical protein